MTFLNHFMHIK